MGCQICFDDEIATLALPCDHLVCADCVQQLYSLASTNSTYECPFTKKEFERPVNGFKIPKTDSRHGSENISQGVTVRQETERQCKVKLLLHKSRNLLTVTRQKIEHCSRQQWDLRQNEEAVEEKIEEMRDPDIDDKDNRIEQKLSALEVATSHMITQLESREAKLKSALVSNTELVVEMEASDVETECNKKSKRIDWLIMNMEKGQTEMEQLIKPKEFAGFKPGDSVCLNVSKEQLRPDFLDTDLTHTSVGYIHSIDVNDDQCEVIFIDFSNWKGQTCQLNLSHSTHNLPMLLDKVRVKVRIEEPHFGWQNVQSGSVGVITKFTGDAHGHRRVIEVDFPENCNFRCLFDELELNTLPAEPLKVGDVVCIRSEVMSGETRDYGSGILTDIDRRDRGAVMFTQKRRWRKLKQLESAADITVGDRVRFKDAQQILVSKQFIDQLMTFDSTLDLLVVDVHKSLQQGKGLTLLTIGGQMEQIKIHNICMDRVRLFEKNSHMFLEILGYDGIQGGIYKTGEERRQNMFFAAALAEFNNVMNSFRFGLLNMFSTQRQLGEREEQLALEYGDT